MGKDVWGRVAYCVEGPTITLIELNTEAQVPNLAGAAFMEMANEAKAKCPVSKALAAVEIKLSAKLVG